MSDSVRPHRGQPTRLLCPWDSPGRNTGVGCHFLLQCMKVKSESEVAQLCPTLSDPWTRAYQAPPSMGFSRQEYWSGVPLPSPSSKSRHHYLVYDLIRKAFTPSLISMTFLVQFLQMTFNRLSKSLSFPCFWSVFIMKCVALCQMCFVHL